MQRIIYNIIILSFITLALACGDKASENSKSKSQKTETVDTEIFVSKAQFEHNKMELGSIIAKTFPIVIKTTGMIDVPPENRAVVNATMGGYIKTVPLLIGDKVKKGQPLVTIENPDFITLQQDYMEVNEKLGFLRSEYERQKTMMDENITSQKSFLQAESNYKMAVAKHNGLKKQLTLLNISPSRVERGSLSSEVTIFAPLSGSITKVNVTRGTYVSPATSIMEIINNEHLHLELSVFEKDIMKIRKDQKINFKVPESSNDLYNAEVHLIGTAIEEDRTIKIHGHLLNEKDANFLTGMFVEAEIVTEVEEVNSLAETAVVDVENSYSLLKLNKETDDGYYFDQILVKIGNTYGGEVSLSSMGELTMKDRILTKGTFNLIGGE